MMTSSNRNISYITCPLWAESTGHQSIPSPRPVMRSFGVFFDLHLNKWLSKRSRRWWFEMPLSSLWHHCNVHSPFKCHPDMRNDITNVARPSAGSTHWKVRFFSSFSGFHDSGSLLWTDYIIQIGWWDSANSCELVILWLLIILLYLHALEVGINMTSCQPKKHMNLTIGYMSGCSYYIPYNTINYSYTL